MLSSFRTFIVAIKGKSERHPHRYCPTVLLEFTVLFLVDFAMRFIPTLVFVTSTRVGEGACVWSLTCTVNWSVGESFTLA